MKENMTEWIVLLFTTLLFPCFITLVISGTEKRDRKQMSGIILEYENGEKVDLEEFLPYAIAGEIDLDYEEETLKAQAVIARTNLMRQIGEKSEVKLSELNVSYLTPEKFESSFGEKAKEKMLYKLQKVVSNTYGETIQYENECIEALYHEVSMGTTVSAEEVFGKSRPYLIAVTSSQDVEAEDYMVVKEWKPEEVTSLLHSKNKGKSLTKDTVISALKIADKTSNGYVKQVGIGSETMTGDEWKTLFGLSSTNFYLEEYNGLLRIISLGKGHGIGMSQYGANRMALEKGDYKTILQTYYPGTTIEKSFGKGV